MVSAQNFTNRKNETMKFNKEMYSKTALIKAAYNYTDRAYIHLDADEKYYYVDIAVKDGEEEISEQDFINEMLVQNVRHEVYEQTKDIRKLLLARTMATSVILDDEDASDISTEDEYAEEDIVKDWFE